jgi:hypothetical protein
MPSLADIALRRFYELAPDEARPAILRQIQDPHGTTVTTLAILPDRELPQLDNALVTNLESQRVDQDLAAGLIQRYASAGVSERVLAYMAPVIGRMACRPQSSLLGYFVRVNEDIAKGQLERALESRSRTGCYRTVLADIRVPGSTIIISAAIGRLNDKDPQVVVSAIEAIGRAQPPVREVLLGFFRQWHREWQGREDELRFNPVNRDRDSAYQTVIELALVTALSNGQLTEGDFRELETLCVTDTCRIQARVPLSRR